MIVENVFVWMGIKVRPDNPRAVAGSFLEASVLQALLVEKTAWNLSGIGSSSNGP